MLREIRRYPVKHACLRSFFVLGDMDDGRCVAFAPTVDLTRSPSATRFIPVIKAIADKSEVKQRMVVTDDKVIQEYMVFAQLPTRFWYPELFAAVDAIVKPLMTTSDTLTLMAVSAAVATKPHETRGNVPARARTPRTSACVREGCDGS